MTSQRRDLTLGRAAYDAYCMQTGGRSLVSGDDLPSWDTLDSKYHDAWITAARAVENLVTYGPEGLVSQQAKERQAAMSQPQPQPPTQPRPGPGPTPPEPEDEGDDVDEQTQPKPPNPPR
jgi:hypothetical protein